ncbi:MAG: DUF4091 domain-containing protein [Pirellulales bacterium]|nr:DUF4091 domain-containing protein [Pirellulales bacterium]
MNVPRSVSSASSALTLLLTAFLLAATTVAAEFTPIINPDFQQGDDAPAGWTLSGGKGRWLQRQILEVTGDGQDSNYWRCDYRFTPGALYHFRVRGRGTPSSGTAVGGPVFANRDCRSPSGEWFWHGYIFRVPDDMDDSYVRLGQWQALGAIQFDAVRLARAIPAHAAVGDLLLGEGESIRDGRYTFSGTFSHQGSNYHRTLQSTNTAFNSDRWTFGPDNQVTYCFALPGHTLLSGEASFNVNYHTGGACTAEVSRDRSDWHPLATQGELGTAAAALPKELLPAEKLYLRLRSQGGSFQVNQVDFSAELSGTPADAGGATTFAEVEMARPGVELEQLSLRYGAAAAKSLLATVKNTGEQPKVVALLGTITADDKYGTFATKPHARLGPGESAVLTLPLAAQNAGQYELGLIVNGDGADGGMVQAKMTLSVHEFYRSDYGEQLASPSQGVGLWWCDAAHKVPRERPMPDKSATAVRLSAARNDREAAQLVVCPAEDLQRLTATAGPLTGPDGATIPAEDVRILRVAYHFVHQPTDKTGVRDFWPDALPPLNEPVDVPAGKNQPLWVLVHVPAEAAAGDYTGRVSLKAEGFSAEVPLKLHVWSFALPARNHIETAFGLSPGDVFRYHGLKTDEDKRRVLDMYLQSFADHRISPYNPAPLDPIHVRFLPEADPPRAEVDFSAFDPAMARAVEKFHFTSLRLPVQGMGGGTFHARVDPRIGNFTEGTPEYQAMFSSYVKQLEDHFRDKGWVEMAYIYWFDEPAPKDYEFVAAGMRRLQRYAPGLRRMLTEEPGENPLAGTVDIWCPVSFNYDHQAAEKRRAHGERFWWYVCCGPKAPYCTLFIDHPATELRTWFWQTWQRDITGVLVWQSNYWTSSAAFPDPARPQNPYEDPMGYVSGYSTPKGTKRFWGNGDGRFLYPPEAAAVPGVSGPQPVLQPPVSSIRWEMLREGIEDYETLYLLRELLAQRRDGLSPEQIKQVEALLQVPESITSDMTTFATDPAPIYARRAEVAGAIERLLQ